MRDRSGTGPVQTNGFEKRARLTLLQPIWSAIVIATLFYVVLMNSKDNSSDQTPISVDSDAFGEEQLSTIINVSRTNELRFKGIFEGRQFAALGTFKEANADGDGYHIAVTVGAADVACETSDQQTLTLVSKLSAGMSVRIYGLIDTAWMGDLLLKRCAITS